ncbi:hypothetical protein B0H14DRAFT_3862547, partial [Mycena olivaceomarginata]
MSLFFLAAAGSGLGQKTWKTPAKLTKPRSGSKLSCSRDGNAVHLLHCASFRRAGVVDQPSALCPPHPCPIRCPQSSPFELFRTL